jgi:CheY-like chemotaxis protein
MGIHSVKLWVVDDDRLDRELLVEALDVTGLPYQVQEFENGKEVVDHLTACQITDFPNFILLDLNMPVMDGRETLKLIKDSEQFKIIPVFVLSTSNARQDIYSSYQTGANLFFVKPVSFTDLRNTLKNLLSLFHNSVANIPV